VNLYSIVGTATTVISFVAFIGIVVWAYGRGRKRAFEEAAQAPFALADEIDEVGGAKGNAGERGQ